MCREPFVTVQEETFLRLQQRQFLKRSLAFALAISVVPALAQEPGGVFTGTLNGKPVTCQIWPMQSDFGSFGITLTVSIVTNPCEGEDGLGQIALSFEQTDASTDSLEIRLFGQTDSPDLYGGTDTGATLELLSASEDGGLLSLSGKVSAQVGPSDDRGRNIDLSAAQNLEMSFSGVIEALRQ
jgi:hypothetical protein